MAGVCYRPSSLDSMLKMASGPMTMALVGEIGSEKTLYYYPGMNLFMIERNLPRLGGLTMPKHLNETQEEFFQRVLNFFDHRVQPYSGSSQEDLRNLDDEDWKGYWGRPNGETWTKFD